jgi:quercetin dioxygenase-like cupin family protein
LAEDSTALIAEAATVSHGRASKTMSKHPGLNVVIAALRSGTVVRKHQASAPVIIQVISGVVRLQLPSGPAELHPGGLATLAAHVAHEVEAVTDASLLIAVATPS